MISKFDLPWSHSEIEINWPTDRAALAVDTPGATIADGIVSWTSSRGPGPSAINIDWSADAFPAASVRSRPYNPYLRYGAIFALVFAPLIYNALMRVLTVAGRALMDEIDGLKLYLTEKTPLYGAASGEEFVRLLPYAVVLDVEKERAAWFGDDLPAAEDSGAQAVIDWYAEMRRQADDATLVVVIIPAITASSSGSGAVTAGDGATAGPW